MQLSLMKPDQVLQGDSSSSQRSLGEEEEEAISTSEVLQKSQEKHNAHVI